MVQELINYDHNVLLVTLDSCRWDVFQDAKTPTMDKIGQASKVETPANFTLPAHISFFSGYLPQAKLSVEEFKSKDGNPLWRLGNRLPSYSLVGVYLDGSSLQEGYRNRGYQIRGFGGTSWFSPGEILVRDYREGEFTHLPTIHFPENPKLALRFPRNADVLPMTHIDEIVDSVRNQDPWFLFINENATHEPYNVHEVNNPLITEALPYLFNFRNGRFDESMRYDKKNVGNLIRGLQVQAVEYVDHQLEELLTRLQSKYPILVVICADHGDSFGENGFWGHLHNAPEVLQVPLIINTKYYHE